MSEPIRRLIERIGAYYTTIGAPGWAIAPTRALPAPVPFERPPSVAADRHLGPALAGVTPAAAAVGDAIGEAAADLAWHYGYPARAGQRDLADDVAFCEIVGPSAGFRSDTARLGLTLIGARTFYPAHAHPAVELYHVLSGVALWTADGITTPQPPGAFVLHPSGIGHAMETASAPLLALYSWQGDVMSPSVYLE